MPTTTTPRPSTVVSFEEWNGREQAHDARAARYTRDHLRRRKAGEHHEVFDFLFEYYPVRASHLHRYSPGVGVALEHPAGFEPAQAKWKWFVGDTQHTWVDHQGFVAAKANTLAYILDLL